MKVWLRVLCKGLAPGALGAAGLWLCAASGCSKPEPGDDANPPAASQDTRPAAPGTAGPSSVTLVPNPRPDGAPGIPTNGSPRAQAAEGAETPPVAAMTRQFRSSTNFEDRFETLLSIGEVGTAEAVSALEELFVEEPDKDLRVELINALIGISGAKEERLRFLNRGLSPSQPAEVREAALDGLVDLEDARALPAIESLFSDPDPAIQALARQLHELARKQAESREPQP